MARENSHGTFLFIMTLKVMEDLPVVEGFILRLLSCFKGELARRILIFSCKIYLF